MLRQSVQQLMEETQSQEGLTALKGTVSQDFLPLIYFRAKKNPGYTPYPHFLMIWMRQNTINVKSLLNVSLKTKLLDGVQSNPEEEFST
jgi:hypothetical protein